jgi:glycosyltransferase involved in cell wall biosynthesis
MKSEPRIAFVIDSLPSLGGGERVLFTALEVIPRADLFTLVYNQWAFTSSPIANRRVNTSFIDHIPLAHTHHRMFLPLMPFAIEQFDLCDYDIIVSFSYAVAHGIRKRNGARHISYTYTPMRYAWTDININGRRTHKNPVVGLLMRSFRAWDKKAASRVGQFVAISQSVSRRIANAYQREATVLYPPVEVDRFKPARKRENYYITVTRLVPHKRVDLIVQAFSRIKLPLLIVGEGPELSRLKSLAAENVQFLGYQNDEHVADLLGKARGFVCATEEDFGIALVEAQAAGCPVLAYGRGGALETVIDSKTGIFFPEQSAESLIDAVEQLDRIHLNFPAQELVQNARRFAKDRFLSEFSALVCF